ncbi:MAG: pyruvate phosphate dikinase PEP/pyruvate-binding [Herbinix sp.]|nr:pyruvate phosphate dikinase PEP/pyruvate-binding [Herbinix sp.]
MNNIQRQSGSEYRGYGEKAARLFRAKEMGLKVPEGFALSFEEFDSFIENNLLNDLVQDDIARGPQLQQKIMEGTYSAGFSEELQNRLSKIKQDTDCLSFVVRSSSNTEDGRNYSMAGMFESYLKLTTCDEVKEAISKCYTSLYSDKVLDFALKKGLTGCERKMGVLVQEYIEGEFFGVMFTSDPVSGNKDRVQLSVFEGESANLKQMAPSTAIYSLYKKTGELEPLSSSQVSIAPNAGLCNQLLSLAERCEEIFGLSMDIEWIWRDGNLYLLQVRPITQVKKEVIRPVWKEPEQEKYEWFRLFPTPLTPLMQDIIASEIANQSKASYETMFRTDTHGEGIFQSGYAYVRSIPIEGEVDKRKAYLGYLDELVKSGICIYHDLHLPKLKAYTEQLNDYINRKLSIKEAEEFLKLSMEYHDYCAAHHWHMVQANEFLYRFEREFLSTYSSMSLSDFYDLISGYTLQTRDRELLFRMSDAVGKSAGLKEMFASCPYDAVLYQRLLLVDEAEELHDLIRQYLEEYGICDSYECENFVPILQERPYDILGYLRRVLDMDSSHFYENLRTAGEKKERVLEEIMVRLDETEQMAFKEKLILAQKAFLTNDNHNYFVERLYRGYLRLAVIKAEELLRDKNIVEAKDDIQYLYYDEILSLLQGKEIDKQVINIRKKEYEIQKSLEAPELLASGMGEEDKAKLMEGFTQKMKKNRVPLNMGEPPMVLKGLSGLKKRTRGKIYVGIPDQPQEAILVMPHCHYGDIMPVISKVKGLIFLWGSPYDHPAIIARELGIPAMYYVAGAMELLKTGDEVEIDGYEGLIHIISRAETELNENFVINQKSNVGDVSSYVVF